MLESNKSKKILYNTTPIAKTDTTTRTNESIKHMFDGQKLKEGAYEIANVGRLRSASSSLLAELKPVAPRWM